MTSQIITGKTRVYGIFGYPVEHSASPLMQNAAFHARGLDCVYTPFPVSADRLGAAVAGCRAMGLAGLNITIPHKESVMEFLDEISSEAKLAAAVNTIVNHDGRLTGYNTDGKGFLRSLEEEAGFRVQGKTVLLLGAGGASRGVAVQIALAGAKKVIIANRSQERATAIADLIEGHTEAAAGVTELTEKALAGVVPEADLIVNSTPLGMYPNTAEMPPLPVALVTDRHLVADLVYNPAHTALLQQAKAAGAATLGGLGMLLYQGAIAFELWTGEEAPVDVMRRALEEHFRIKA